MSSRESSLCSSVDFVDNLHTQMYDKIENDDGTSLVMGGNLTHWQRASKHSTTIRVDWRHSYDWSYFSRCGEFMICSPCHYRHCEQQHLARTTFSTPRQTFGVTKATMDAHKQSQTHGTSEQYCRENRLQYDAWWKRKESGRPGWLGRHS